MIGAYVADAAALGFHWLYDPARIAELAQGDPAFRTPDPADFEGYKGVFVHPGKRAGDMSQYGAQLRIAMQSMLASDGRFETADFQDRFAACFGPGGPWTGYIDKATKGTLANLAADKRDPSGADDDQVPAIARFPAVMAQREISAAEIDACIAITSANETARVWGPVAAKLLEAAYGGAEPHDAARSVAQEFTGDIGAALASALDTANPDTVAFAGEVGRACPLPQAMPVIVHICARATSYREAIERNILAGGDSCGRAPVLGAVFAAHHGLGGNGVPPEWLARVADSAGLARESTALAALHG